MERSETIGSLATALAKANMELSNPGFDKKNSHFNNGYASLAAVLNAIRQPLAKQGISLLQTISTAPGIVTITTSLIHASGEWISADVSVSVPGNATAQAVGSATTYMRRYSALSMCGIAGDDDDAEEDRRDRDEKRPMAPPAQRTPAPAAMKSPASRIASASAATSGAVAPASSGHAKKWPEQGTDVVTAEKVVERSASVSAVLFSHPSHGRQWVSVPHSLVSAVSLTKPNEIDWNWNKEGFFEATRVGPAPKPMKPEDHKPVASEDIPF